MVPVGSISLLTPEAAPDAHVEIQLRGAVVD